MPAIPVPFIKAQWFDANGDPLAGGKLYSFEAGTSTPKVTYTDAGAGTPNANPTILDAAGRANVWLSGGAYKLRMDDANDVVLWTVDDVPATSAGIAVTATANATLACTDNAVVLTASSLVPANAKLLGVYVENLVAPGTSKGLSGYDIGSHGITDRWGANIGLSLNNKNTMGDFQIPEEPVSASAQDITIEARGGQFDGTGSIQVTIEFKTGTAP
jgi:hypothetical protein